MAAFGKFPTFAAFIENYDRERQLALKQKLATLPLQARMQEHRRQRDVVEVMGAIQVHEPDDLDGDKHYRLRIVIREVKENDEDVAADVQRCITEQAQVFIAIRYGDSLGIREEIPGLDVGAALHLRG